MKIKKGVKTLRYYVDDIRNFGAGSNVQLIEARSPPTYPDYKVTRVYNGIGDIVVGRYTRQYWGRGYRTYVYKIEKRSK